MDDLVAVLRSMIDDDRNLTPAQIGALRFAIAHIASEPSRTAVAVGEERERCARVVERHAARSGIPRCAYDEACADIATAIHESSGE